MSSSKHHYYPSNDDALVFTLDEALSEIRALRSQKRVLAQALSKVEAAFLKPSASGNSEKLRAEARIALENVRPLLPSRSRRATG